MKKSEALTNELNTLQTKLDNLLNDIYINKTRAIEDELENTHTLHRQIDALERQVRKEERREIEVGDGCTVCLYSDREAYTVIRKTKTMIVLQRDKAIKDPNFKPEWVPGGFSAVCLNQEDQAYTYEADPDGRQIKAYWSENDGCYKHQGCRVINGRHEFYDYNF